MKKTLVLFIAISCLSLQSVLAQTIIYVNSTTGSDVSGTGTASNPFRTFHRGYTAAANGNILDLTGTFSWTDAGETGDVVTTGYTINKQLTIRGRGAGQTFIQAANAANLADRRVLTLGNHSISIRNLTIRYGYLNTSVMYGGAGIYIGSLSNNIVIEDCNIEENTFGFSSVSQWYGGGGVTIHNTNTNANTITFNRCNIRNNTSASNGAAIWSYRGVSGACRIYMNNSTISNNTATGSGHAAIFAYYAYYDFLNTTIANNVANRVLNISWDGHAYFTNTTVAYNNLGSGGHAVIVSGSATTTFVYVKNSIFAQNKRSNNAQFDFAASNVTVIDNGNNIVETQNTASFTNGTNGNIVGIQPNLNLSSTLASNASHNGTQTLALKFGSIAINAGSNGLNGLTNVTPTDQRGMSRVGATDIGAAEFTTDTWSGAVSSDWNATANWMESTVPAADASITIPALLSNYPVLDQSRTVGSMNMESGAHTTLNSHTLSVNGKLIGAGFFKGDLHSSMIFTGTGELGILKFDQADLNNRLSSLTINRLPADKGSLGSDLEVNSLTLTSGIIDLNEYTLTTTEITGGSASSYLNTSGTGKLKAIINHSSSVTFPVGKSAFNPVTINNNSGAADEFSVRVRDEVLRDGSFGNAIGGSFVQRTWDIDKAFPNAGDGINFIFYWNSNEVTATIPTPTLFHYGTKWDKQTGTTHSTATSLSYTGYTGSFSPFAIMDANSTLPVTWLSFTSDRRQETVLLQWKTSSEQNTKDFIVEHSNGTGNWNSIGKVAAAGSSNTIRSYQFVHHQPVAGSNNYRLLQRDEDGRETYSKILSVLMPSPSNRMLVYPTFVTSGLLHVNLPEASSIRVYNSNGTFVHGQTGKPGLQTLQLQHLRKGTYYLKAGSETATIVIQ